MWFKKNKWKIIAPVLIIAILAAVFYIGGDSPGSEGWKVDVDTPALHAEPDDIPNDFPSPSVAPEAPSPTPEQLLDAVKIEESPIPEPAATPILPEISLSPEPIQTPAPPKENPSPTPDETPTPPVEEDDGLLTCTIYILCDTILDNMDLCDPSKVGIVPSNGWILGNTEVEFTAGETVFDVLQRVCREKGIHMEFMEAPAYNSVYIEGIYNLYEFDVGNLSGWMYKVNGWFPNYGCSLYTLQDGDIIGWVYTCDLGADVGGGYATGNGMG